MNKVRNDTFAKSWAEVSSLASSIKVSYRKLVENTYMPMEARAVSGLPGMASGSAGFSVKWEMRMFSSTDITAEFSRFQARYLDTGHRHIRFRIDMMHQHLRVIHCVDMIAA